MIVSYVSTSTNIVWDWNTVSWTTDSKEKTQAPGFRKRKTFDFFNQYYIESLIYTFVYYEE